MPNIDMGLQTPLESEIVDIDCFEDISSRPNYVQDIDPASGHLRMFIGAYKFKDKVRCGLSTCHEPHNCGLLAVMSDGRETNIGRICGHSKYDVDFEQAWRLFKRTVENRSKRRAINDLKSSAAHLRSTFDSLWREQGCGAWAIRMMRLFRGGCPLELQDQLEKMVRSRDPFIYREVALSQSEIEMQCEASIAKPQRFRRESIGIIEGLPALYPENDLDAVSNADTSCRLNTLASLDVQNLKRRELVFWSDWCKDIEAKFGRAADALYEHQKFFTIPNLQRLALLPSTATRKRKTQRWLHGFLKHLAKEAA